MLVVISSPIGAVSARRSKLRNLFSRFRHTSCPSALDEVLDLDHAPVTTTSTGLPTVGILEVGKRHERHLVVAEPHQPSSSRLALPVLGSTSTNRLSPFRDT